MNAPQPLELLERTEQAAPIATTAAPVQPLSVIEQAIRTGATADQLERLLELQVRADTHKLEMMREKRRMDEEDRQVAAKSAYYAAMAQFKATGVRVLRNKDITDGPLKGKKHATVSSVADAANEALSRFKLSAAWRTVAEEKDWIKLSCVISHADGYSEEASFGGPVDTGPGRNAIQARKSTLSYLERITMELVLGLAEHDDDDDGAAGGKAADPLEVWSGRATLAQSLGELDRVSKDGAKHFKGAGDVEAYRMFATAVQTRGAALRAAGAQA